MTARQTDAITDPQSIIAALQQRLDAAVSEKATLAEELAARDAALALRNSEFGERIEQQTATIDVLKAMSASPGDPQPVFDLIVRRARALGCEWRRHCSNTMANWFTSGPVIAAWLCRDRGPTRRLSIYANSGVHPPGTILDGEIVHIRDGPDLKYPRWHANSAQDAVSIPLMRDGQAIGVISLALRPRWRSRTARSKC